MHSHDLSIMRYFSLYRLALSMLVKTESHRVVSTYTARFIKLSPAESQTLSQTPIRSKPTRRRLDDLYSVLHSFVHSFFHTTSFSTMNPAEEKGFLNMPYEIRDLVYQYIFSDDPVLRTLPLRKCNLRQRLKAGNAFEAPTFFEKKKAYLLPSFSSTITSSLPRSPPFTSSESPSDPNPRPKDPTLFSTSPLSQTSHRLRQEISTYLLTAPNIDIVFQVRNLDFTHVSHFLLSSLPSPASRAALCVQANGLSARKLRIELVGPYEGDEVHLSANVRKWVESVDAFFSMVAQDEHDQKAEARGVNGKGGSVRTDGQEWKCELATMLQIEPSVPVDDKWDRAPRNVVMALHALHKNRPPGPESWTPGQWELYKLFHTFWIRFTIERELGYVHSAFPCLSSSQRVYPLADKDGSASKHISLRDGIEGGHKGRHEHCTHRNVNSAHRDG